MLDNPASLLSDSICWRDGSCGVQVQILVMSEDDNLSPSDSNSLFCGSTQSHLNNKFL